MEDDTNDRAANLQPGWGWGSLPRSPGNEIGGGFRIGRSPIGGGTSGIENDQRDEGTEPPPAEAEAEAAPAPAIRSRDARLPPSGTYGGAAYGTTTYGGGAAAAPDNGDVGGAETPTSASITPSSAIVGTDSRRKIRLQAIGRVEEFAGEILATTKDEQAREAAELALLAARRLSRYVDDTPDDPRAIAWAKVLKAARELLPEKVVRGMELSRALHELARAYGLPWDFRASDAPNGD